MSEILRVDGRVFRSRRSPFGFYFSAEDEYRCAMAIEGARRFFERYGRGPSPRTYAQNSETARLSQAPQSPDRWLSGPRPWQRMRREDGCYTLGQLERMLHLSWQRIYKHITKDGIPWVYVTADRHYTYRLREVVRSLSRIPHVGEALRDIDLTEEEMASGSYMDREWVLEYWRTDPQSLDRMLSQSAIPRRIYEGRAYFLRSDVAWMFMNFS